LHDHDRMRETHAQQVDLRAPSVRGRRERERGREREGRGGRERERERKRKREREKERRLVEGLRKFE
jgi:hypothetical protein